MTRFDQEMQLFEEIKKPGMVIITSNGDGFIDYDSHVFYLLYNLRKSHIADFFDKAPNPYNLNRTLKHQMELLAYELNNPKLKKPAC